MLAQLIRFSVRRRLLVLAAATVLLAVGAWQASRLPVDVLPDLNRPTVVVMTEAEGLAPEEVELLVTVPVESVLNGAAGVRGVRSVSSAGLSVVTVEFDWGASIMQARQIVAENLALAADQLPEGITPHLGPVTSVMGEIMLIGLTSSTRPPEELRLLADWTLRPRLLTVSGVSQVIPIGGGRLQVQIQADPAKLRAFGITFADVSEAVRSASRNTTGGFVERQEQEWLVRNIGRAESLEDMRRTVVAYREGRAITLGQVAEVRAGTQVRRGGAGIDGGPGVILSVQKQPHADSLAVTRDVQAALAALQQTLPEDVTVHDALFLQSDFIETAISNVLGALGEAAILVTLTLIVFLLNPRTTLITLIALPLSVLVTALVFRGLGISINTMTLGGIAVALGELVDDAIVDIENIQRRLRENRVLPVPRNPLRVVHEASNEVRSSIVYATTIMVLVMIPLLQLSDVEGRLFQPLGLAYVVAILASLLVSLTVTPALAAWLLTGERGGSHRQHDTWLVRLLKTADRAQLRFSLRFPGAVMGLFYGLAALALVAFLGFGREFLSTFNEGTLTVTLTAQPGISLSESERIGRRAEHIVLGIPEVLTVGRRTGRAELDEHAEGVHVSELEMRLGEGRRRAEVMDDIRAGLSAIRGITVSIGQPISHRIDHLLSGVMAQVAVKIFADDLETLRRLGETVEEAMADVPGVVDLAMDRQVAIPQVQVRLLRDEARRYGVQVGALAEALQTGLYGAHVAEVQDGVRRYDVVVMADEAVRLRPEALGALLIDTLDGSKIPLSAVADVVETAGPNMILREGGRRRMVVQANVRGRDLSSTVEQIRREVEAALAGKLPEGAFLLYEGQYEAQRAAARTIYLYGAAALAIIYVLLYNRFRTHRVVWCILFNVPLALIGCVTAIGLTGGIVTIASLLGFLTVTGISVRNGILLIEHYRHLMKFEGEGFTREMVVRGSLERLVPVLMTASTSALAMVPFMLGAADSPGKEILGPLALVVFSGTVSATVLDLIYTPAFFWRWCGPVVPRLLAGSDADSDEEPTGDGQAQFIDESSSREFQGGVSK